MWQPLAQHGFWQGEIWNKRKNGEIYPQTLTINAIYNKQQQRCAYAAFFNDISQQKMAPPVF
jgi:PAS domain-containing protein